MQGTILITTALNKLNTTIDPETNEVRTYGFRYIKKDGTLGEIYNARKQQFSSRPAADEKDKLQGLTKGMYNLKRNSLIMLVNDEATTATDTFRNIKKPHIVGFRDYKSNEWLQVKH
jgi:hypothetical protein